MSAYEVGRLIFDLRKDRNLAEQFRASNDGVMEKYGLTPAEKQAVHNKDIKFIYQLGVNPYLIIGAGAYLGLSRAELILALADAGAHPTERTTSYPGPLPTVTEDLKRMAAGMGQGSRK
jgi:Aromatic-ring-opening dioxygenase LigAB, LigA subunit